MPGIDYVAVRAAVGMALVLRLIGFESNESSGDEVRGPCPIHGSTTHGSRSFAANVRKHTFQCFKCGVKGNQLDLWAAVQRLTLHEAARDLCDKAGVDVPAVRWW